MFTIRPLCFYFGKKPEPCAISLCSRFPHRAPTPNLPVFAVQPGGAALQCEQDIVYPQERDFRRGLTDSRALRHPFPSFRTETIPSCRTEAEADAACAPCCHHPCHPFSVDSGSSTVHHPRGGDGWLVPWAARVRGICSATAAVLLPGIIITKHI